MWELILGGYCIYRELFEVTTVICSVVRFVILVGGFQGLEWVDGIKDAVICTAIVLAGFFWDIQLEIISSLKRSKLSPCSVKSSL
jgi:hypothetical protein